MKKSYGLFLLLTVLCIFLFPVVASAQQSEPIYQDYSRSQSAYGESVALLNRSLAEKPSDSKTGEGYTAVLCRSDGTKPDFGPWAPEYVVAGPHDCYTLFFPSKSAAEKAAAKIAALPGIRYAECDAEVSACAAAEYSFLSWGAEQMHYDSFLSYSLPLCQGSTVVAVVDSGVYLHSLLASRILESGYDYVDADNDATNDLFGHGTNVAGIVADCTPGAAVYLYPIRVLGSGGTGNMSNVVNAVREATEKSVGVINLSLESTNASEALDDAVADALASGITVVAAAGNHSMDTSQVWPAHIMTPGMLVVGAAEANGNKASYSNYGASVDLYTYGTGIRCCSRSGGYVNNTGTSMAAPHISALAALIRMMYPGLSPAEVEYRVTRAVEDSSALPIPELLRITPQRMGFRLSQLSLHIGDSIAMPMTAYPATAMEDVSYQSSDPAVLAIEEGVLTPLQEGAVTVTASCRGLESCSFAVQIAEGEQLELRIPGGVLNLEDEAFLGDGSIYRAVLPEGLMSLGDRVFDECNSLRFVVLPDSLTTIGSNAFSGAVILCDADSAAENHALENELDYVSVPRT